MIAAMEIAAPLALHRATVRPEWLDVNDHMNVAYYVLAFDHATDALFEYLDLGRRYIDHENRSLFALESHVTYQRELRLGDDFHITTQLLDADAKRLHFFHRMIRDDDGELAATSEWIDIHVDMAARRAAPLPERAVALLDRIREAHAGLGVPPEVGRVIGLKKRVRK